MAVEVAEGVLRRDDERVGVDPVEHRLVGRVVRVHVADRADADAPGAEDHLAVDALGLGGEGSEHRAHRVHRGDGQVGVVVPAGQVVHASGLADADEHAVEVRHLRVELVEAGCVDVPEGGILRGEAAEPLDEVLLERRRQREHVGAEVDVEADVVRVLPHRPEGLAHRVGPRHVRVVGAVHVVAVADAREREVLDETRDRDRVVALGERVAHVELEVGARDLERRLVDVGRVGEDDVGERLGVVRVVVAGRPGGLVHRDADGAEVDHAEPEPGVHGLAEVLVDGATVAGGSCEVVHAEHGAGLGCRDDAERVG